MKDKSLTHKRRTLGALVTLIMLSMSCSSSTGPDDGPDASPQQSTIAAAQSSIVANGTSTTEISVVLKDASGVALGEGGGVVSMSTTRGTIGLVTDKSNGTYTATLTSSTSAGSAVVSAAIAGAQLSSTASVAFLPGAPTAITVSNAASNNQSTAVGSTVATPPSVKIADANGNAIPNVAVSFAVTSGGGSITGPSQTTNESGVAAVGSWRLGNVAGQNTLTATVSGASAIAGMRGMSASVGSADLVITFTATATAGAPGSIIVNAGDGQTAVAGTAVTVAPSVKVLDANNNPVSGASVNFFIGSGAGSLTGASTTTNASGIATVGSWTLGATAGANTLTAGAVGLSGSASFTATGIAGAGASIAIADAASTGQLAAAGSAVAIVPPVRVTDANGNGVAGVSVTFAVATGGGSVTGANATTNASGIATVGSWTLGSAAGANTLTATSGSLTGSPVTFSATGTAGSAGAISIVAGNGQTAIVGAAVTTAPSVKVTDVNNNPVSGTTVTFAVASGGGGITGATATTNASGIATAGTWTLGTTSGANTLSASAGALTPATFTATGIAGPAALITINAGNNQTATTGTAVAIPPSVKITDANSNVVSGAAVTFAVATGGGSITGGSPSSNASGIASVGSWTLGSSAGANTLAASLNGVSGASVTFAATGSANATLSISVAGRRERSITDTITVTLNGTPLAPSAYTLTLVPADGGQVNSDGTVKLLKTGQLTINATNGTATGTTNITVAQPPLVVFDLVRNFTRQVWQVAIDGGDLLQLTNTGSDNQHGSRVGNKLVYAGARNGRTFDVFSLNLTTSVETQITNTTFAERDPNLSPNGNRLVYASNESGLDRAVYSNADGTGIGFVADNSSNTGAIEISPAWSPSSDKVIYSTTAEGGTPDLWIQQTLGAVAAKLPAPANSTGAEINGVWNSSNQIAFHTTRSGSDEIWLTTTTGAQAAKLTNGASPTWLADGRIVFVRFTGATGVLYWIDPANPSVVLPIDIGAGDAQRPSAVLP